MKYAADDDRDEMKAPGRAVHVALASLERELDSLEKNHGALEGRLEPVLCSSDDSNADEDKARRHGVPIADQIQRMSERIEALSSSTTSLITRLHV